ncbi:MAG: hypothetical protein IH586_02840, partial [Anaerolineaceae bacterium]|nr:hypothetical protein [Anaerolineaceae bacterium]
MDWKKLVLPLFRWWWLLIAATLIASISSFLIVRQQPAVFQAKSTLMIGRTIQDPNPNSSEFGLAQQLAQTYAEIGRREPVQKAVKTALGLSFLPEITIRTTGYNPLIEIAVIDTDPNRAQAVANELANQLIERSPSGLKPEEEQRQQFVNDQLNKLQKQIDETQANLTQLQQELGELNSAREIAETQTQIKVQQEKLDSLRENYTNLLSNTQQGASNIMTLIEPAEIPTVPIGPKKNLIIGLSSFIGLFLAVTAVFGMEALDDTIKTSEDFTRFANVPIIGRIGNIPKNAAKTTYVLDEPGSSVSESFRLLRTYLEFLSANKSLRTILV